MYAVSETTLMRWIVVAAMLGTSLAVPAGAEAKGCIRGAIVGGIAGHLAGHGLMGAAAGCAVGHHYANRQQRPAPGDNTMPNNPQQQQPTQ